MVFQRFLRLAYKQAGDTRQSWVFVLINCKYFIVSTFLSKDDMLLNLISVEQTRKRKTEK